MYKLFSDKPEIFECDIKIEGTTISKSNARLVVETVDYSLMFNGKIDSSGKCQIPIKKLKGLIDESVKGDIRLEVIADDTYFIPWQSTFEIEASKKVTVEIKSQSNKNTITENNNSINNKIIVSNVKNEVKKDEINHITNILKLLVKEDINLSNLKVKKDRLNKIIAIYTKHKPLNESEKSDVIKGILKRLNT